jgi:CBS-domain-containing membrane protein
MKVSEIMTRDVLRCSTTDSLERAAQVMWEHDLGALPVLDARGVTVAMVTDRDACMAAYTQGKPLREIPVMSAASQGVRSVHPDDPVEVAQAIMKMHRVRRLPVIDVGGNCVGMVSLADMLRRASPSLSPPGPLHSEVVAMTIAEVYRPHDLRRHPLETRDLEPLEASP